MSAVHEAVNKVMESVQKISKDQRNAQQNFAFRGIDDVMNAVGPALREHGVIIAPEYVTQTSERYTTGRNNTEMENVKVVVTYRVMCTTDDSYFTAGSAGGSADAGDKALSKAMSVAYRTLLLQLLCIPTGDPDPDADTHTRLSATTRAAEAASGVQGSPIPGVTVAYNALGAIASSGKDSAGMIQDVAAFKAEYGQVLDQTVVHEGKTVTLARLADQVATSSLKS